MIAFRVRKFRSSTTSRRIQVVCTVVRYVKDASGIWRRELLAVGCTRASAIYGPFDTIDEPSAFAAEQASGALTWTS